MSSDPTFPHHYFSDGSLVSLSLVRSDGEKGFLSPRNNPNTEATPGLVLRGDCNEWESFRLSCRDGGAVTLQHCGGRGFLSPVNNAEGDNWTFRDHAPDGGWEHLVLYPSSWERGLPVLFAVGCNVGGERVFLGGKSIGTEERVVVGRAGDPSAAPQWRISLFGVPLLNLNAFGGLKQLSLLCTSATVADGPPGSDVFVRLLLRAMTEAGFFYLIGANAPGAELFAMLQAGIGLVPWRNDAASGDQDRKTNMMLMQHIDGAPGGTATLGPNVGKLPPPIWNQLVFAAFQDASSLCDVLLHALALAQSLAFPGASVPAWRGAWSDGNAFRALRVLVYHPGPLQDAGGKALVTTARHTDATWLTLLREDDVGGLRLRPPALGKWVWARPPVAGAVLVNAGNVLAIATRGADGVSLFGAVCHQVQRVSETATRVSMPFFYDRKHGASFHGGGTGGC